MPRKSKGSKAPPKVMLNIQQPVVKRLRAKAAVGRKVGSIIPALGGLAGSFLGGPAGGAVGLAAGKLISAITGYGDYKISRNSISMGNSVPTFRQGGDGIRVCHREFIQDITGSIAFNNTVFSLNPGLNDTFPWLSLMGSHFEEYEMNGLVFEYRPSSGSAVSSTSSALGVVILATDYDAANIAFATKQQMESYEFSTSTVPFNGALHPVECARSRNVLDNLYLRTDDPPVDTDIRLYDMGRFQIATQGMQSAYVVGELWVSYDVTFRKPRIPIASGSVGVGLFGRFNESPATTSANGVWMGTDASRALQPNSTMTIDDVESAPGYLTIKKPGEYALSYESNGRTSSSVVTLTTGTNIVGKNSFGQNTTSGVEVNDPTSGVGLRAFFVTASGSGVNNRFNYNVNPSSGGYCDVLLTKISAATAASITSSCCGSTSSRSTHECKACGFELC